MNNPAQTNQKISYIYSSFSLRVPDVFAAIR